MQPMKTKSELTNLETNPYKLISNDHGCIVVNERLDYDYFYKKVVEYIWITYMYQLAVILRQTLHLQT